MKIIAEREKIVTALKFVSKYADAKSKILVLECVKFSADQNGVTVTATDLDKAATDLFGAHIDRPGSAVLNGALLAKAIDSTDASEVLIDVGEREAAIQIGNKLRLKLPVFPAGDFPDLAILTKGACSNFTIDASLLRRHASEVAFAESKETRARQYLCGTRWAIHRGLLDLCATDGVYFSLLSVPAPDKQMPPVTVPPISLPDWVGSVDVSVDKAFARFTCGHQVVATKLVEGNYPDYRRALPENSVKLLFDRTELSSALARVALIDSHRSPTVLFVGRDGKLSLSAVSDGREINDEISFDGEDFQISFVLTRIAPTVSSFSCETIEWRWADHATPITIHDPRDDSRIACALPYRDARLSPFVAARTEAA